jgi:hypothetical protein
MKLASQLAFAAACTAVAAELHAFQRSRRIASIDEYTPRVGRKQVGLAHSLAFQNSLLRRQALCVRGGKRIFVILL